MTKQKRTAPNKNPKHLSNNHRSMQMQRTRNITYVLNQALGKFYTIGDKNTLPMSFHLSDLHLKLKGDNLRIAKELMVDFLFGKPQTWNICFYHYFKIDDEVTEVTPVHCTLEDVTYASVCDYVNVLANETKQLLCESEEFIDIQDKYTTYAYQINWGDNLDFDSMDPKFIEAIFKITKDLSNVKSDQEVIVNGYVMIDQVKEEKFSITDSSAATSNMISVEDAINEFNLKEVA